jgi:hypothetical protein
MDYNFLKRCNGYTGMFGPDAEETALLKEHLPKAREHFRSMVKPGDNYEFHYRFNGDDWVWDRIASAANEGEFKADPYAWCMDALRDCAATDHWYLWEKDYN